MRRALLCLILLVFQVQAGCGKTKTPLKPFEVIQAEVETMSLEELQATARQLVIDIYEGKQKLDRGEREFKSLSPEAQAGRKGKAADERLGRIRGDVNARAQRYHLYADKIRALGAEPPKFEDVMGENAKTL